MKYFASILYLVIGGMLEGFSLGLIVVYQYSIITFLNMFLGMVFIFFGIFLDNFVESEHEM